MLVVERVGRIRREHFVRGKSIKEIARDLRLSRNTVRKILRSPETAFAYEREVQPQPKLGRWTSDLDRMLEANATKSPRERLTLIRVFEDLHGLGYQGGYDAVRRYARAWQREHSSQTQPAFVPLSFAPGEACQFDWSHEVVLLNGVTVTVKVAHMRLCHSRMPFVRAYPRETQEMVFDAHERAFAFFKGACTRGIYDNMKTAVETVFVGKDRQYNRRFPQMCAHHLVEPVACTPAAGWEKGQVENQVGVVRERFFTPRLRFKTRDELNAWLLDKCVAGACPRAGEARPVGPRACASRAPGADGLGCVRGGTAQTGRLSRSVRWVPCAGGLGLEDLPGPVRQQQILGERQRGGPPGRDPSVCGSRGHPSEPALGLAKPDPWDGRVVAEHPRSFGRGEAIYDPWHYVPVLARKPGALRNGAPFKDWVLPTALEQVRRKLTGSNDGDRQMVAILAAVLTDGLPSVEAACAQAMADGVHSSDVILNILSRRRDPGPAVTVLTPDALRLRHAPVADCARYDQLRSV